MSVIFTHSFFPNFTLQYKSLQFPCSRVDRTIGWNFRFDDRHSCLLKKTKQI